MKHLPIGISDFKEIKTGTYYYIDKTLLIQELLDQGGQTVLCQGDGLIFEYILREYLMNSISMFDLSDNEAEKSYHLFVLGLLVTLSTTYDVRSNRESGYGRYDIMLTPKDTAQRGIIIEFKRARANEDLEIIAQDALDQINKKEYATELRSKNITNITAFGIAFRGKEMLLKTTIL